MAFLEKITYILAYSVWLWTLSTAVMKIENIFRTIDKKKF